MRCDADYILDLDTCKICTLDNIVLSLPEYSTLSEAAYGASRGIMLTLHSEIDPRRRSACLWRAGDAALLFSGGLTPFCLQRLVMALGKSSGRIYIVPAARPMGQPDRHNLARFPHARHLHLLAISGEHL